MSPDAFKYLAIGALSELFAKGQITVFNTIRIDGYPAEAPAVGEVAKATF